MVTLLFLAVLATPTTGNGGNSNDDYPRGGSCDCDSASADGDPTAALLLTSSMLAFLKKRKQ